MTLNHDDALLETRIFHPVLARYSNRPKRKTSVPGAIIGILARYGPFKAYVFRRYIRGDYDSYFTSSHTNTSLLLWMHEEIKEWESSLRYDELLDIRWAQRRLSHSINSDVNVPSLSDSYAVPPLAIYRWYYKQLIRRRPSFINQLYLQS